MSEHAILSRLALSFIHISLYAIIVYPIEGQKIYSFIYSAIKNVYRGLSTCQTLFLVLENIEISLRKDPCFQGPYAFIEMVRGVLKNPQ